MVPLYTACVVVYRNAQQVEGTHSKSAACLVST